LTNPHNPTGAVTPAPKIQALAAALAPSGGTLVSSEVYMECAPRPSQRVHAATLAPNGISIGSLTKAYGLGPLRLGWILLGAGLVDLRATLVDRAHLSWVDPPSASLLLGQRALDCLPALLQPLRRIEAESRPLLDAWIENNPRVRALIPPFGIFAFAILEGVQDTQAFARWLAREHQVDVVAGEFFGYPGAVRIGAGLPPETLAEGLQRLEAAHTKWCAEGRG
jgi:aspartate/methionine/tyrosine aminotransferase